MKTKEEKSRATILFKSTTIKRFRKVQAKLSGKTEKMLTNDEAMLLMCDETEKNLSNTD